jgi:hypothetical protein
MVLVNLQIPPASSQIVIMKGESMTLPSPKRTLLTRFIFVAAFLDITGCARGGSNDTKQTASTSAPTPAKVTANDLKKLTWIEGTWLGTGYKTPFYERYRFENGNTRTGVISRTMAR